MATSAAHRKPAAPAASKKIPAPEAASPQASPAKRPKRRRSLVLALLALASGAGAGAWYVLEPAAEARNAPDEPRKQSVFVPLDTFTVNLAEPGIDRYLQLGVTLEAANAATADELKRQMPVIRSRILLLLSAKTAEELATTPGKHKLMAELLDEVRAPLPASDSPARGVENAHLSTFVIQ
jgi:flagellar FliL protein